LDLAKIEAGKMDLHPSDFILEDVLVRLMALFSQVANIKGNTLHYEIASDIPACVIADETRLLQILSNLTSNSLKFTERGKVVIALTMENRKKDSFDLLVRVTDTGVGISEEDRKILFNAFQQLDNSTTKVHGGTGLGLAISREFCKMMQGDIGVESELGKGSTFWFKVHLKEGNPNLANQRKTEDRYVIGGKLADLRPDILLVDDNATNRKVAGQILIKAGCSVHMASSGHEAIEKIKNSSFDLILMDIQMPEMDGMETTERLKQLNLANLPPIIAMTAYAMREDRERFMAVGMNDYLAKPIRAHQLINMVIAWVTGSKPKLITEEIPLATSPDSGVDHAVLEALSIALGGDQGFMKGMLVDFIAEAEEQIAQSEIAFRANNCQGVQAELHTLKGNSGTLGAAAVHVICQAMEKNAKVCNFENFETEIGTLKNALNLFKTYVDTL
jgi:CheY-like chemotaxis protein